MPDTYTSQFSGEEIDAALRAAQMISGASTPAELRDKLEIRGDTIPVSATDPTPVSEALTASGGGVNPNLLDNWFFGRPVNQRGGYIVPAGVDYYTFAWEKVGQTDKNYQVLLRRNAENNYDCEIEINGTRYVVAGANSVPGYCAAGYTVDRWKFNNNSGKIVLDDTGIMFTGLNNYAEFDQKYEFPENVSGKECTSSILVDSFSGEGDFFLVIQNQTHYRTLQLSAGLNTFTSTFWDDSTTLRFFVQSQNVNESNPPKIHILAAKLELGDQQTLAHKENGVWVLNEIPDFGEQLRRCQRYYLGDMQRDAPGRITDNNTAYCVVPIPVTMRQSSAEPVHAISKHGNIIDREGVFHIVNNAYCVVEADSYLLFAVISTDTMPVGPCVWQDGHFSVSKDL